MHADKGYEVFERIKNDLASVGIVEKQPKIEGKNLTMVIVPAKKKG